MVRTLISLTKEEKMKLDRLSRQTKKSRAQLVREALDKYMKENEDKDKAWKATVLKMAGMWEHKGVSTDEYLANIRKDWDR